GDADQHEAEHAAEHTETADAPLALAAVGGDIDRPADAERALFLVGLGQPWNCGQSRPDVDPREVLGRGHERPVQIDLRNVAPPLVAPTRTSWRRIVATAAVVVAAPTRARSTSRAVATASPVPVLPHGCAAGGWRPAGWAGSRWPALGAAAVAHH